MSSKERSRSELLNERGTWRKREKSWSLKMKSDSRLHMRHELMLKNKLKVPQFKQWSLQQRQQTWKHQRLKTRKPQRPSESESPRCWSQISKWLSQPSRKKLLIRYGATKRSHISVDHKKMPKHSQIDFLVMLPSAHNALSNSSRHSSLLTKMRTVSWKEMKDFHSLRKLCPNLWMQVRWSLWQSKKALMCQTQSIV